MYNKTVFVIGAGASKEANLPSGYDLKGQIADLLDIKFNLNIQISGDYSIAQALRDIAQIEITNDGFNAYLKEASHVRDALPLAISIDNFIDSQKENKKIAICGKLGIVKSILDAEKHSLLYYDISLQNINFKNLKDTWYLPFFQLITENCEVKHLEERFKSIALIIFNYDRCLEHFLFHALQNYYRVSSTKAVELINYINIYHPYGSVGSLPWLAGDNSISFGEEPDGTNLRSLIEKIKTFTEGTDPNSSEIAAIKDCMTKANKLVFIGFAFHKLNMQLISTDQLDTRDTGKPKCYATTFGISESDKEVIADQIKDLYGRQITTKMANLKCRDFFMEFWRSLAFSMIK